MDFASIVGVIICFVLVIFGMLVGQSGIDVLWNFVDVPSVFITLGGSFFSVMIMSPSIKVFLTNLKSVGLIMRSRDTNEGEVINSIIDLANVARKEGLLALEDISNNLEDEFLKKGIILIVDGTDPELIRGILDTELECIENRHADVIGFWESLASMGPAWGMIGTLIGLINMLKRMEDTASIGPNMAVALITTFYGAILANWICIPFATKLKKLNSDEIAVKELMVEGLLSIQAGENPRVIEEKLKSFLSPAQRREMQEAKGGEEIG